ncbi:helix-turn-helix domain-containing protein [Streptomyces sp. NPDC006923]|uniref:winged helix-turn-helix transcriptional regulator n=1 Tax=Streptomyces sp. NPDC006923 TaxID=3155355 RepID=UPI0033CBF0C6
MKAMELPQNKYCSIARSLEVLGLKWNLLIMREAFFGRRRYAEFRQIGVPTDILSTRLASLVEEGLLERRPYREPGERMRDEYVLTEAAHNILPILAALTSWGDGRLPTGREPASLFIDEATGQPVTLGFADGNGTVIDPERVRMVYGPGATRPKD